MGALRSWRTGLQTESEKKPESSRSCSCCSLKLCLCAFRRCMCVWALFSRWGHTKARGKVLYTCFKPFVRTQRFVLHPHHWSGRKHITPAVSTRNTIRNVSFHKWKDLRERGRAESTQTDTSGCCCVSSVPVIHMYSRLTPALLLFLTSAWDLYTYLRHLGQWVVLTADMAADVLVHYGDVSFSWELDLAVMSTANKSSTSLNTLIIATSA